MASFKTTEYNSESLDNSYVKWVSRQMEKRVLEYSDITTLSVFCGTWNVNARVLPESCDLREWIIPSGLPWADIYVMGLQEIVDLNVVNVVLNSRSSDEMSAYWVQKLTHVLSKSDEKYSMVSEKHLVGLAFVVFVKTSLLPYVTDVRSTITCTGGRGLMGNKGGIVTRMDVFDSSLCFVCAHFHADRDNVTQRNLDYQTILETAVLMPSSSSGSGSSSESGRQKSRDGDNEYESFGNRHRDSPLCVLNHEQVYWLGDLNYRICDEIDKTEVFDQVLAGQWETLRGKDQLNMERAKNNVFQGFEEGLLTFPPTYKYQPGTDVYETRAEKKLRAPAWCDRVLWRATNKEAVRLVSYRRAALNASDHKPVSALFSADVRTVIPAKMKTTYQELLFSVDKWVNASAPKIAVEGRMMEFPNVHWREKAKAKLELRNTGSVMAEWLFVPKNDELLVCKPWVRLYPTDGILAPGESAEVEVAVALTPELVYQICNTPKDSDNNVLEDIIVLRVVRGSDFFCIVSGTLAPVAVLEAKAMYASAAAVVGSSAPHIKQLKGTSSFYRSAKSVLGATPASPDSSLHSAATAMATVRDADSADGGSDDHLSIENIYVSKDDMV